MPEQRDKELAAIGASIGANCRPCIEHHIVAGREAGLSELDLADAVATATAIRQDAVDQLSARVAELLGRDSVPAGQKRRGQASMARELVALGRVSAPTHTRCCASTSRPHSVPG